MITIGSQWKHALQGAKFSFLASWVAPCMARITVAKHFGLCGHHYQKNLKIIDFYATKYKCMPKVICFRGESKIIIDKPIKRRSIMGEFDFVSFVGILLIIYGGLCD
jgi:hypothetical protein